MRVDEIKIKKLIADYLKNNESKDILIDIIKEISEMVYNYPKVVFKKDLDVCADFYIYFISNLKKIILQYNPKLASFNTYLNIVLKSRYINWFKKKISKQEIPKVSIYNSNNNNEFSVLIDKFAYNIYIDKHFDDINSNLKMQINNILKKLPLKERLIAKLLFYPLDVETLKMLSNYLNTSIKVAYNNYIAIYKKYNLIDKQNELRDKILNTENKIYILKNKIEKLKKQNKNYTTLDKLKQKMDVRLSKYRLSLYKNLYVISLKGVKELLKISKSEVYAKYNSLKQKLQQELSQYTI